MRKWVCRKPSPTGLVSGSQFPLPGEGTGKQVHLRHRQQNKTLGDPYGDGPVLGLTVQFHVLQGGNLYVRGPTIMEEKESKCQYMCYHSEENCGEGWRHVTSVPILSLLS